MATRLICKFWEKVFEVNRFYNSALNLIEQKRISQCQDSPRCWKGITLHADNSIIDQVPEMLSGGEGEGVFSFFKDNKGGGKVHCK